MLKGMDRGGAPAPRAELPSMTLGTYLAEAGKALRTNLPKAWVEAVVLDAKATRQGLKVELVEPMANDRQDGRLSGLIWSRTATTIADAIGLPLDATTLKGAHVRMLIKTTFSPRYHLEGEVLDLDPAMVQGLVAKQLEAIRRSLRDENLLGAQQMLPQPDDVTAIAVIHPAQSAGWADVRAELERLQKRGIVRFASHPVPFEGRGSAAAIADALANIGQGELPDLVLIIRGGGAAAGLASLANLDLARAVCRCRVPIVTGLGHASDRTIIDDLAWRAADTPSKALGVVKSILRRRCLQTCDDHRSIVEAMDRLVTGTLQPLLLAMRSAVAEAVDKVTTTQAARLREMVHGVERHVIVFRGTIDLTQADLDRLAGTLLAAAPNVPRTAAIGLASLYGDIAQTARARLPRPEALSADALRSAGVMTTFLEQQKAGLDAALAALENNLRRRLSDETSRLAAVATAAKDLDLTATLGRGFVLAHDRQRRIIRSAKAAQAAERLELLFVDGQVACRPTIS